MSKTAPIRLSAPMTLAAAGADAKLPAKFSGICYAGSVVNGDTIIDIASTRLDTPLPLLAEHSRSDIVGRVEGVSKGAASIGVSGSLYSDLSGSKAEQIARLAARGASFQMSIGLFSFSPETVAPGRRISVNDQTLTGPATVLRGGTVRECSIVTLGADARTSMAFFSANSSGRAQAIDKLFADLGEVIGSKERDAYMLMEPGAFGLLDAKLRQLAGRLSSSQERFSAREAAMQAVQPGGQLRARDIYAARRMH